MYMYVLYIYIDWEYLPEDLVCTLDDWREREHKKENQVYMYI